MNSIPQASLKKKNGFSLIWVIPIVAVLIGGGLIYKAMTEKGPVITITFETAEGLEAGKTKIKYKDLDVGQVDSIELSKDLSHVIVTASMLKGSEDYLNETTQFYVVRARFSGGVASGLGTLLSGSYIAVEPGEGKESKEHFTGLETPPVISSDKPGRYFQLKAAKLGSLQHGSPIHFKGIQVGQVAGYTFSETTEELEIKIFIEAPYDGQIYETTRFWFASGLDMVLNANGVRIDTQSFVSMMIGGIAFDNPNDLVPAGPIAQEDHIFPLYNSPDDALSRTFTLKEYYLLKFDDSVRGLSIGAPVEFRGIPVGKVVDIFLEHDKGMNVVRIPVKVEVEPERVSEMAGVDGTSEARLKKMISHGLRAQLKTGNLLTGSKYIALDFHETAKPATLVKRDGMMVIPTIHEALDELTSNLNALMDKISRIPYEEISDSILASLKSLEGAGQGVTNLVDSEIMAKALKSLNQSLSHIERLTAELEHTLPAAVDDVSGETVSTLEEIRNLTASDSAVVFELRRALEEFTKTARSFRVLADQLERHPESLIQGKGKE